MDAKSKLNSAAPTKLHDVNKMKKIRGELTAPEISKSLRGGKAIPV